MKNWQMGIKYVLCMQELTGFHWAGIKQLSNQFNSLTFNLMADDINFLTSFLNTSPAGTVELLLTSDITVHE